MKGLKALKLSSVLSPALILALSACAAQSGASEKYIGTQAAKSMAFQDSGVAETEAVLEKTSFDTKNGIAYYEIDFSAGGYEYEYDIDALTGVVIESKSKAADGEKSSSQTSASTDSGVVGEEAAKEAALAHAGLSADDVTFIKTKLDKDDGRRIYEVEFYSGNTEYDYELDAYTGEIISYDYDAEGYEPSTGTQISADEAKNIALSQVSGATVNDIFEFETDYDDGRLEYEGKIYYSGMEYEFSIDGYSGAIREWEAEPIDH